MSTEYVHSPKLIFASSGPRVVGFLRTEQDQDQVTSRKMQTDQIRGYAAQHGMREPWIMDTASRKELSKQIDKGSILIVPLLSTLLRRPSDVAELFQWIVANGVVVHCIQLGGEISDRLSMIRVISDCYLPVENEGGRPSAPA